jgi:hypothetical protein
VKVPCDVFAALSVAAHSTWVVPIANRLPPAGVQTTLGLGSRSSVAVAVKATSRRPGRSRSP